MLNESHASDLVEDFSTTKLEFESSTATAPPANGITHFRALVAQRDLYEAAIANTAQNARNSVARISIAIIAGPGICSTLG